jgi:hypothetical protein
MPYREEGSSEIKIKSDKYDVLFLLRVAFKRNDLSRWVLENGERSLRVNFKNFIS